MPRRTADENARWVLERKLRRKQAKATRPDYHRSVAPVIAAASYAPVQRRGSGYGHLNTRSYHR